VTQKNTPNVISDPTFQDYFWSRCIRSSNGCLEWQGSRNYHGYGEICVSGKAQSTHRVAWMIMHGLVPDGMCVLHRCDNPSCCDPVHLFLGTKKDNSRDMAAKGRNSITGYGERNLSAKLTAIQIQEIRSAYVSRSHEFGQCALARRFGVSQAQIGRIVRREKWAHIQ
jgi:hypothetical protein